MKAKSSKLCTGSGNGCGSVIQAKLKPAFVFGFAAGTRAQIKESLLKLASSLK
jgi:hypothetical protein